jgi:hypothetical protein
MGKAMSEYVSVGWAVTAKNGVLGSRQYENYGDAKWYASYLDQNDSENAPHQVIELFVKVAG